MKNHRSNLDRVKLIRETTGLAFLLSEEIGSPQGRDLNLDPFALWVQYFNDDGHRDRNASFFGQAPPSEQHELLIAMLRRSGELPDTIVADDQLVGFADELFQTLDAEESNGSGADAG